MHPISAFLADKAGSTAEDDRRLIAPALFALFDGCGRIKELLPADLPLLVAAHADEIRAFPVRTLASGARHSPNEMFNGSVQGKIFRKLVTQRLFICLFNQI